MTYDDFKAKHKANVLKGFDDIDGRSYWAEFKADLHTLLADERKPLELQVREAREALEEIVGRFMDVIKVRGPGAFNYVDGGRMKDIAKDAIRKLTEKPLCDVEIHPAPVKCGLSLPCVLHTQKRVEGEQKEWAICGWCAGGHDDPGGTCPKCGGAKGKWVEKKRD